MGVCARRRDRKLLGRGGCGLPCCFRNANIAHDVGDFADNDLNMRLFHDVLEMRGYNILQAKDGMEGWRIARLQHSAS